MPIVVSRQLRPGSKEGETNLLVGSREVMDWGSENMVSTLLGTAKLLCFHVTQGDRNNIRDESVEHLGKSTRPLPEERVLSFFSAPLPDP